MAACRAARNPWLVHFVALAIETGMRRSELLGVQGIDLVGDLPAGAQSVTVFAAGVCTSAREPDASAALLDFLASPEGDAVKIRFGMQPVRDTAHAEAVRAIVSGSS